MGIKFKMTTNATQTTLTKLPKLPAINPKEELAYLKSKNQEVDFFWRTNLD